MNRLPFSEAYVSVDVETAGPNPAQYSLLSIGACLVADPRRTFCVELQPVNGNATAEALTVTGLSLKELAGRGLPPAEAMACFEEWLKAEIPSPSAWSLWLSTLSLTGCSSMTISIASWGAIPLATLP